MFGSEQTAQLVEVGKVAHRDELYSSVHARAQARAPVLAAGRACVLDDLWHCRRCTSIAMIESGRSPSGW
jgi:hypothetical protein